MRVIACRVNMFDNNQIIYEVDTETNQWQDLGMSTVKDLPNNLLSFCAKGAIDQISLYGTESYLAPVKLKVEQQAVTQYGKKVKVTINNE